MPSQIRMNSALKTGITVEEVMQGKMLADCMLDSVLSNLQDSDRTERGVQAVMHTISRNTAIAKMTSAFLSKTRKDPSYLSQCSAFQKRILLFIVTECVLVGENLSLRFTTEKLTPLETVLGRLSDVALAFENVIDQEKFCKVWSQTVKQTVIMFLKNNQDVDASKILVLYRDRIMEGHQEILKSLIKQSSQSRDLINQLIKRPGHDYATYYAAMADFLKGLNSKLEQTTLKRFAQKITTSLTNVCEDTSESDSDTDKSDWNVPLSSVLGEREEVPLVMSRSEIESHEELTSELDFDAAEEENNAGTAVEHQNRADIPESGTENSSNTNEGNSVKSDALNSISPKMSLSYRLKKQSHSSGIIIPCKHIVEHCRKVNHEEDAQNENTGFFQAPSNRPKTKTSTPLLTSSLTKSPFKFTVPARNFLLGERFEDLNSSIHSTSSRTYSNKRKMVFNIELDSYIIAGCRHFGVGQWTLILNAFPFSPNCTNVKIKDRFRTLVKLNYIAILDDGDFSVLNNELKSKLPAARTKMKSQGKENNNGGNTYSHKQRAKKSTETEPANNVISPENGGGQSETTTLTKISPTEEAYLLCGARHLGPRWNLLKEYFDFRPHIDSSDMQERWESLISEGKIEVTDEDPTEIICNDSDLERQCENVTKELKKRIQDQRKSFAKATNDGATTSESGDSSVALRNKSPTLQRRKRLRAKVPSDGNKVEEQLIKQPAPIKVKPKPKHMISLDAGTQTKRPKFALRKQSPSILDGASSSSESGGEVTNSRNENQAQGGSPIRPSTINLFKQSKVKQAIKSKRERTNSLVTDMRERRQREISRMQRRKVPGKKKSWNDEEIKELFKGLSKHGPGKWSQILDDGWEVFNGRTSVMIKDKFRNLLQHKMVPEDLVILWEARKAAKK